MYCISALVNSTSLEVMLKRLCLMKLVFCSEKENETIKNAVEMLNIEFNNLKGSDDIATCDTTVIESGDNVSVHM